MNFEELEELIRKYLSAGVAVVVILVAPGTDPGPDGSLPSEPSIEVIEPDASGELPGSPREPTDPPPADDPAPDDSAPDDNAPDDNADDPADDDRTGAGGRDPERDGTPPPAPRPGPEDDTDTDSDTGSGTDPGSDADTDTDSDSEPGNSAPGGTSRPDSDTDDNDTDDSDTNDSEPDEPADRDPAAPRNEPGTGAAPDSGTAPGASEGTTAAEQFGWGTPNREDDFSAGTDQWGIYDGPGHGGQGTRSPSAVSVEGGILTITGDSSGTTAGMAWNPGQMYGRWEGRVRAPAADPSYNALMLLWPDAEDFPVGGEVDFMEMMDPARQQTDLFIHYGEDNSQVNGSVEIDGTQWHNWAVEWTPDSITAFVDGEEWYRTTDTSILPPGPMHLCIQLDWFPEGDTPEESSMQVDWVRQYSVEGGSSSSSGTADGPGNGDPGSNGSGGGGADNPGGDGEQDGGGPSGTAAEGDNAAGTEPGAEDSGDDSGEESRSNIIRDAVRRMFSWR